MYPIAQGVHEVAPAEDHVPAGHVSQNSLFASVLVPAGHWEQVALPAMLTYPTAQGVHELTPILDSSPLRH